MFAIAPWMWGVGVVAAAGIGITAYEVTRPKASTASPAAASTKPKWVAVQSIPKGARFAFVVVFPNLATAASQGAVALTAATNMTTEYTTLLVTIFEAQLRANISLPGSPPPAGWPVADGLGNNAGRALGTNTGASIQNADGSISPIIPPVFAWVLQ